MIPSSSALNQGIFAFGDMSSAQPQVQPQMTGFNAQMMGQFQPMLQQPQVQQQQSSFGSNPFTQMASLSTPTNSFGNTGGMNPFSNSSQPMQNVIGFRFGA